MTAGIWANPVRTNGPSTQPPDFMTQAVRMVGMNERDLARFFTPAYKAESATKVMPIFARVNQGRWIADCRDCTGAEVVFDDGWTLCVSCILEDRGIDWRRVVFPRDRLAIEQALAPRRVENRNWEVEETVVDLLRDNMEHGL